ncbi:unnamed protein product, partial [Staurois parvus]
MVGVTSQVQQVADSAVPRVRQQKDGQERAGVRAGEGQHKSEQAESLATRKRTYRNR